MTEEKKTPRELLILALKHFDDAQEYFEMAKYGLLGGRDEVTMKQFYRLRDALMEALAPVFVPPADPADEPYNVADERWDTLKEAWKVGGSASSPLVVVASRALAEAAAVSELEWKKRRAEMEAKAA